MFLPIISILLFVFCDYTISYENQNFCNQLNFGYIFNLGKHIYFYTAHNMWRYNYNFSLYPNSNSDLSPYKNIDLETNVFQILKEDNFDMSKPIFTIAAKQWSQTCSSSKSPNVGEECNLLYNSQDIHRVCIFGTHLTKNKTHLAVRRYDENIGLQGFQTSVVEQESKAFCESLINDSNLSEKHKSNYLALRSSNNKIIYSSGVSYPHPKKNTDTIIIMGYKEKNTFNFKSGILKRQINQNMTIEWNINNITEKVFGMFYYRKTENVYVFDQTLTLSSKLYILKFDEDSRRTHISKTDKDSPELGLIMKCPKQSQFAPYEFCFQTHFQSIFSLGPQIFFVSDGKFWRFDSLGFTADGNPDYNQNIGNIRYDTDMSNELYKYFDLSQPVTGFTFNFDGCKPGDNINECRDLDLDPLSSLACIIGQSSIQDSSSLHMLAHAFRYTPAGLRQIFHPPFRETVNQFCGKILDSIIPSLNNIHHISALSYYDNSNAKTEIIFVIKKVGNNSDISLMRRVYEGESISLSEQKLDFDVYKPSSDSDIIQGLFFDYRTNSILVYQKAPIFTSSLITISKIDYSEKTFQMTDSSKTSLTTYFKCPFNQSYPRYMKEYFDICNSFPKRFHVFNIGIYIYLQYKAYFYRFYIDTNRLVYDKYFSNLMNDHFDTSQHLYGISDGFLQCQQTKSCSSGIYPEYTILLWGKPKYADQQFLPFIYRAYKFALISGLHKKGTIKPIINRNDMPNNLYTFGKVAVSSEIVGSALQTVAITSADKQIHYYNQLVLCIIDQEKYFLIWKTSFEFSEPLFDEIDDWDKNKIPYTVEELSIFGLVVIQEDKSLRIAAKFKGELALYKVLLKFQDGNQIRQIDFEDKIEISGHCSHSDDSGDVRTMNIYLYVIIAFLLLFLIIFALFAGVLSYNKSPESKSDQTVGQKVEQLKVQPVVRPVEKAKPKTQELNPVLSNEPINKIKNETNIDTKDSNISSNSDNDLETMTSVTSN